MVQYKIQYTYSARNDIKKMKKYILFNFKYRQLADSVTKKIKRSEKVLKTFPEGHESTGFAYRGYNIHIKPGGSYLLFYIIDQPSYCVTVLRVLQDGMDWKYIIAQWLRTQNLN